MNKEQEALAMLTGIYCALSNQNPTDIMKDVIEESKTIEKQVSEYLDSIKCSKITKGLFVEPMKEAIKSIIVGLDEIILDSGENND